MRISFELMCKHNTDACVCTEQKLMKGMFILLLSGFQADRLNYDIGFMPKKKKFFKVGKRIALSRISLATSGC